MFNKNKCFCTRVLRIRNYFVYLASIYEINSQCIKIAYVKRNKQLCLAFTLLYLSVGYCKYIICFISQRILSLICWFIHLNPYFTGTLCMRSEESRNDSEESNHGHERHLLIKWRNYTEKGK